MIESIFWENERQVRAVSRVKKAVKYWLAIMRLVAYSWGIPWEFLGNKEVLAI